MTRLVLLLSGLAGLTLAALPSAGCPAASIPHEPDPALAVVAYRDALVAGRPRDALRWIHHDAREGLDEQGFEALYQHHREALIAQAEALVRVVQSGSPTERARVHTERGDVMLVKGPDGWRLLGPVGGSP
jgi:hypothetical protein